MIASRQGSIILMIQQQEKHMRLIEELANSLAQDNS